MKITTGNYQLIVDGVEFHQSKTDRTAFDLYNILNGEYITTVYTNASETIEVFGEKE